jgi:transposase
MGELARSVQEATSESVELAYVDQGYTGERPAEEAQAHGMRSEVVKHKEAKRGFVLLPRRWVVERDFAWASRFRRLAKDYERLPPIWRSCTSSPSLASSYVRQPVFSVRVHNTL